MAARELDLARFEVDAGDGDSGKGRGENAERRPGGAADLEHALAIPIVEPERNQGVAPVLRLPDETFLLRRRIAEVAATSATGWLTGEPSQALGGKCIAELQVPGLEPAAEPADALLR